MTGAEITLAQLESAWQHVEENAGTAGVDGMTTERFAYHGEEELRLLLGDLTAGRYHPLPLLEMRMEKKPGSAEFRRLLLPAVRDRIVETAVATAIMPVAEQEFVDANWAYRPGRGVDSAVARVIQLRDRGFVHVLHGDVEAFFDHLHHPQLLEYLAGSPASRPFVDLIGGWIRRPYWDGEKLHPVRQGVPQGSPISPLLSNFYLEPFDVGFSDGEAHLVRYADDFLLLCQTPEGAREAAARAKKVLGDLGLRLNEDKTMVTSFAAGFEFLGVFFLTDKAYTPWRRKQRHARVFFLARPMTAAQLQRYTKKKPGRPKRRTPIRHHHPELKEATKNAMPFLYLSDEGSVVRKSGDRILVDREGQVILDLPYHKLENVLLFGNVQVTGAAMAELLEHRISLSIFTRHGNFLGALAPPSARNVEMRIAQFDAFRDPAASFEMARAIVAGKVRNSIYTLRQLGRRGKEEGAEAAIRELEESVAATEQAGHIQALDGIEGSAARGYFTGLMGYNKSGFTWPGRQRHPAPDPINALLSLTYTLLTNELHGLLEGAGLDVYIGFLHQLDYGRPSLALDLVEAFRGAVADRMVLALINQNVFQAESFRKEHGTEGLFLDRDAIKTYFGEYEKWMLRAPASRPAFRRLLQAEVELLARHFRDGSPWGPFQFDSLGEGGDEEEPVKGAECNT